MNRTPGTGEKKASSNDNRAPKDHRKTLAQVQADPHAKAGGGTALRRLYKADRLHRGGALWIGVIAPKQRNWAQYLGAETIEQLEIPERETVRDLIADDLFISFSVPQDDSGAMLKEIRAAMNSNSRRVQWLSERRRTRKPLNPLEAVRRAVQEANQS